MEGTQLRLRALARLMASMAALVSSCQAHAFTPTVTPGGLPVRWKPGFKFNLAGNPTNQTGLSDQDFFAAVTRGLRRWESAGNGSVRFDYWQGTNSSTYEPDSEYNGLSSIYFASNARGDPHLSPNVLGLTQVWYDTGTGEILEADIVLNDRDFRFTTDPSDTSGYGLGSTRFVFGRNNVFVENVITHELGHAIGLSHSGMLQSTMLFMESPEQAHLACDDLTAVRAVYGGPDPVARGALEGRILGQNGAPVLGAHVLAISRVRGVALASSISDRSGAFRIPGLEPGDYFLMVEPFFGGAAALPGYYAQLNAALCLDGRWFSRRVITEASGGKAQAFTVLSGRTTAVQPTPVSCDRPALGMSSEATAGSASPETAPTIYDGSGPEKFGFGTAERLNLQGETFYRLKGLSGKLDVHALSYTLYSPARTLLRLFDASGSPVADAESQTSTYQGESGYTNHDARLTANDLPPGDYLLAVSAEALNAAFYPAGPTALDSVPFALLAGTVNPPSPALAATLPVNGRCRMDEDFADYRSPPGDPVRTETGDRKGIGFCARIRDGDGPSGRSAGGSAGGSEIAGWLLPWLLMGATLPLARAMDRFKIARPAR